MRDIEIDGKNYPCRVTMGALLRYRQQTGEDVSDLKSDNVTGVFTFLWCCIKSASDADGVSMPWGVMEMADKVSPEQFAQWSRSMHREQNEDAENAEPQKKSNKG